MSSKPTTEELINEVAAGMAVNTFAPIEDVMSMVWLIDPTFNNLHPMVMLLDHFCRESRDLGGYKIVRLPYRTSRGKVENVLGIWKYGEKE